MDLFNDVMETNIEIPLSTKIGLITAIPLSKTLGLPVPLQLPRVNTKQ